jgi:hypothetical protein
LYHCVDLRPTSLRAWRRGRKRGKKDHATPERLGSTEEQSNCKCFQSQIPDIRRPIRWPIRRLGKDTCQSLDGEIVAKVTVFASLYLTPELDIEGSSAIRHILKTVKSRGSGVGRDHQGPLTGSRGSRVCSTYRSAVIVAVKISCKQRKAPQQTLEMLHKFRHGKGLL